MKYRISGEAAGELEEAIVYYNSCQMGLGIKLLEKFEATIQRIVNFPNAWTPLTKYTRRCLLHQFPYSIVYSIEENVLLVEAFMHMHRKP